VKWAVANVNGLLVRWLQFVQARVWLVCV